MKYVAQVYKQKGNNNFLLGRISDEEGEKARDLDKDDVYDAHPDYIYFGYSEGESPPFLAAFKEHDKSIWSIAPDEVYNTFEKARLVFFNKLFA